MAVLVGGGGARRLRMVRDMKDFNRDRQEGATSRPRSLRLSRHVSRHRRAISTDVSLGFLTAAWLAWRTYDLLDLPDAMWEFLVAHLGAEPTAYTIWSFQVLLPAVWGLRPRRWRVMVTRPADYLRNTWVSRGVPAVTTGSPRGGAPGDVYRRRRTRARFRCGQKE